MWKRLLGNHVEVGLPHIATDETDRLARLVAEGHEEPPQTVLRSLLGYPQQPLHAVLDLIHQRQVVMPSLPLDLIHADGLDGAEILMGHAPENRMFDRLEHVSPSGAEHASHLVPGQMLRPASQEPAITRRQMAFPPGPWHSLHRHATTSAVHPPHGIHKKYGHPPQGYKLEPPLRQPIVTRPPTTAAGANRLPILAGMYLHFDRFSSGVFHPSDFFVGKGLERFDLIEDSFK